MTSGDPGSGERCDPGRSGTSSHRFFRRLSFRNHPCDATYGVIRSLGEIKREEWQNDGALIVVLQLPAGTQAEVYERLKERAAADRRTLPEETLHLLKQALRADGTPAPRLPDVIPGEETSRV